MVYTTHKNGDLWCTTFPLGSSHRSGRGILPGWPVKRSARRSRRSRSKQRWLRRRRDPPRCHGIHGMFERHDFYGFLEESFFWSFYIFLMMFDTYVMMFDDLWMVFGWVDGCWMDIWATVLRWFMAIRLGNGGFPWSWGDPNSWMVYLMETPPKIRMDDWGYPHDFRNL